MKYPIHHLLNEGKELLKAVDLPEIEIRYLLEYCLDKPFALILTDLNAQVDEQLYHEFLATIESRIQGKPLQYITHRQNFMGYEFYVDKYVLIPRPETELLVEQAMAFFNYKKGHFHVIDLCSGSGCIGISLLKELKDLEITLYGIDYSKAALAVSKKNELSILGTSIIEWIYSDLLAEYKGPKVDLLVSNPPYISPNEIQKLDAVVKDHEPLMALDGGIDGLDFYRRIIEESYNYILEQGVLMFEIGQGQMNDVISLMEKKGFKQVKGIYDYNQLERIVIGVR